MTPLTPLRSTLLNNILNQFKLNHNWLKSPEDHKQTNIISLCIIKT